MMGYDTKSLLLGFGVGMILASFVAISFISLYGLEKPVKEENKAMVLSSPAIKSTEPIKVRALPSQQVTPVPSQQVTPVPSPTISYTKTPEPKQEKSEPKEATRKKSSSKKKSSKEKMEEQPADNSTLPNEESVANTEIAAVDPKRSQEGEKNEDSSFFKISNQ